MKDIVRNKVDFMDMVIAEDSVLEEITDLLKKKDVVYSREYATTPDMNCPVCGKSLLTNYPRFCSDCGTRLHYRNNEEDD